MSRDAVASRLVGAWRYVGTTVDGVNKPRGNNPKGMWNIDPETDMTRRGRHWHYGLLEPGREPVVCSSHPSTSLAPLAAPSICGSIRRARYSANLRAAAEPGCATGLGLVAWRLGRLPGVQILRMLGDMRQTRRGAWCPGSFFLILRLHHGQGQHFRDERA